MEPNEAENTTREISPNDKRVWRNCNKCSHKWMGVPTSAICPKCKKYCRPVKRVVESKTEPGIMIESQKFLLPPLPGAPKAKESSASPDITAAQAQTSDITQADIPADTYANVASFPFELAANMTQKPFLKLTAQEKATLAPLLKKVGDKWITKYFDKYPEEGMLALSLMLIISGKFAMNMSHKNSEKITQTKTFTKATQGQREIKKTNEADKDGSS